MSRAARLLSLIQALQGRRQPVSTRDLAEALGIAPRTLFRDIAALRAEGAPIAGDARLGYVLRPGSFLPPLILTQDEADAVMLGLHLVEQRGDAALTLAAFQALAKVVAVLPPERRAAGDEGGLLATYAREAPQLAAVRLAIRQERRLRLDYADVSGSETTRTVWPIVVGFFEATEILAAWCELRQDFRHFRLDRIADARATPQRMPRRRRDLLAEWRARQELD